ncbi:L,D-transpeptidase [Nordella sp. HKS 07]|uniref:L,D-transpeptidase n=1 Tax=Nordella sp. HKS 07 TaxID=2712222 RepID=UPI0013E0F208|nr:L,D-transpeptidase [Nordella sp. HKS 07]QIG50477.1 L,D-transpeptidase [Nordella sp. HKS 07]
MGISRRVFVTSVLASGLFANRQALALAGEPFPVFESDAKEIPYKYRRRTVDYATAEPPGTIVVDTGQKFLFHVQGNGQATRYGVGVGKAGRTWYGEAVIGRKEKWPVWVPTPEHLAEFPDMAKFTSGMPGGKDNPMGARALYLYQGDVDTVIRIHGAVKPSLIGKKTTAGCISLINIDVIHLYDRVELGTRVVILPPAA